MSLRGGKALRRVLPALSGLLALGAFVSAPRFAGASDPLSPIQRAIGFLYGQQVKRPVDMLVDGARVVDFLGDWPQYFHLRGAETVRVRDVSPFTVAFIHHALSSLVESDRHSLGLRWRDLQAARAMRRRAVDFMKHFESPQGVPDAGTFAFWPYDADPSTPDWFLTILLTAWLRGPILGGARVPINLPIYPSTLAIPSDADVTATTYAVLLDDRLLDGGDGARVGFERFFTDWRDVGVVPRRLNPWWLPWASGGFLTWLTYRDSPFPLFGNDVDLVVNGNVLYALGRYHRLDVAGVNEAVGLVNLATALGLHRDHLEDISDYYPNNLAYQYIVSRAFHEGHVAALQPAVTILVEDLEASAIHRPDGRVYWDLGDAHLNTAFAVLALLNAGSETPLIDGAIDYLISEQDARGGYGEGTFFVGRSDGGQVFEFTSEALTTAMVMEALVRHQLAHCSPTSASAARLHSCGS